MCGGALCNRDSAAAGMAAGEPARIGGKRARSDFQHGATFNSHSHSPGLPPLLHGIAEARAHLSELCRPAGSSVYRRRSFQRAAGDRSIDAAGRRWMGGLSRFRHRVTKAVPALHRSTGSGPTGPYAAKRRISYREVAPTTWTANSPLTRSGKNSEPEVWAPSTAHLTGESTAL